MYISIYIYNIYITCDVSSPHFMQFFFKKSHPKNLTSKRPLCAAKWRALWPDPNELQKGLTEGHHFSWKNMCIYIYIWMFPKIGVPQNGWFIMENPIKMDDLGVVPRWFVSRMGHQKWFFDMYKTLVVTKVENTRTHLARKNDELILGNWN